MGPHAGFGAGLANCGCGGAFFGGMVYDAVLFVGRAATVSYSSLLVGLRVRAELRVGRRMQALVTSGACILAGFSTL